MELEDTVYLAIAEGSVLQYGFKLLGPDKVVDTRDNDKVLAAFCAQYWQATGILEPDCACAELQVDQSGGQGLSATHSPQPLPSKRCFDGKHVVFWTHSHTAKLKQKVAQAGAKLEDTITEDTQLVVAARDTSATDAAANLAAVPKAVPLLSKKWEGRKLKIPTNIDFVVPQYISDCLVQGRTLPTNAYLIALQQVATKDTRTYSNEEAPGNSSEAQEVNQRQQEAQAQPQQPHLDAEIKPQVTEHHQDTPVTAVSEQQEGFASASAADTPAAPPATEQTSSQSAEPVTGLEANRLGIYPDVNPQGRVFTGGATGVPWGRGRTWTQHLHTCTDMSKLHQVRCCFEHVSCKNYHARCHIDAAPEQPQLCSTDSV